MFFFNLSDFTCIQSTDESQHHSMLKIQIWIVSYLCCAYWDVKLDISGEEIYQAAIFVFCVHFCGDIRRTKKSDEIKVFFYPPFSLQFTLCQSGLKKRKITWLYIYIFFFGGGTVWILARLYHQRKSQKVYEKKLVWLTRVMSTVNSLNICCCTFIVKGANKLHFGQIPPFPLQMKLLFDLPL